MNRFTKAVFALVAATVVGCSTQSTQYTTSVSEELAVCPVSSDASARAAASLAFKLMQLAAKAGCGSVILAPQMYRETANGIAFDPANTQVTQQMKDVLALAQQDSQVAAFLVKGLNHKHTDTYAKLHDGLVAELATGNYVSQLWCGQALVTFNVSNAAVTSGKESVVSVAAWSGHSDATPWTPFNGDMKDGNPYLFVSKAGKQLSWQKLLNRKCVGADCGVVEFDPTLYSQSDTYYINGVAIGSSTDVPYVIEGTDLYANVAHKDAWATRWVLGCQEWGQFSTPIGNPVMSYKYIKRFGGC